MITLSNSFVRSRFSRRIFALFFLSAFIPVTVAALVSYTHVADQLRRQAQEQTRQSSKAIGMGLYERLSLVNNELTAITQAMASAEGGGANEYWQSLQQESPHFSDIEVIYDADFVKWHGPRAPPEPALSARQARHLNEGLGVVAVAGSPAATDIVIMKMISKGTRSRGILVGTIDPTYLWQVDDMLADDADLVILAGAGRPLVTSEGFRRGALNALTAHMADSSTGYFELHRDGAAQFVAYWSLFTEDAFSMPEWTIAVNQSGRRILAPIAAFRSVYIPALVLMVLAISLVSVIQIRKKLAPLTVLKEATRGVARGDLTRRVTIDGNDELAQLGAAFNSMTARLDRQFRSLATLSELDRLILSSFDTRRIVSIVLQRACDLTRCALVAMIELKDDDPGIGLLSMRHAAAEADIMEARVELSNHELGRLEENSHCLLIEYGEDLPSYLKSLPELTPQAFLLLPMFIKERLAAIVVFGYDGDSRPEGDEISLLRRFADHVAVALSNARWEERLYRQAHYDSLTKLPNRALLADRLEQAITRAGRTASCVGVVFLDLDRFKVVNDLLGHEVGDRLLGEIAQSLAAAVRSVDTVVRFGGDEFIVIVPDIDRRENVIEVLQKVAEKILMAVRRKVAVDGYELFSDTSMGIAVYPQDGVRPEELIKNADAAMYHAKKRGQGQYSFFSHDLNAQLRHRVALEQDLRRVLANGEFRLFFQARMNARGDTLLGAEALIRWQHREQGLLLPDEFIGIAEETGLIHPIGEWVVQEACAQMKRWRDKGLPAIPVAVNISVHQFGFDGLESQICNALADASLGNDALEIEVTESVVVEDADKSIETLWRLRDRGIRIAVDDFGTGYSSLSYLHKLPVNTIKIDRSFINDIVDSRDARAIVASTIHLAHELGLDVVAEGVETQAQQTLLVDWDCDEVQGFLFSKPLPAAEFEKLLLSYAPGPPSVPPLAGTGHGPG